MPASPKYRLVTRSDFGGLVCAVLRDKANGVLREVIDTVNAAG